MEITKHEILFSVVIVLAMLALGLFISNAITKSAIEQNEVLQKALKVDGNTEAFSYSLDTHVPNILAYGEAKADQTVSFPELTGTYSYICKHKERYTMHTRVVTTTDSEGHTHTHTEIYYSWDAISSTNYSADTVHYLGRQYNYSQLAPERYRLTLDATTLTPEYVDCASWNYLYESAWDKWSYSVGDIRYYYTYAPKEYNGSLHVQGTQLAFHYEETIEQVLKHSEASIKTSRIIFWALWILLTGGAVYGFYYIDNRWLE